MVAALFRIICFYDLTLDAVIFQYLHLWFLDTDAESADLIRGNASSEERGAAGLGTLQQVLNVVPHIGVSNLSIRLGINIHNDSNDVKNVFTGIGIMSY